MIPSVVFILLNSLAAGRGWEGGRREGAGDAAQRDVCDQRRRRKVRHEGDEGKTIQRGWTERPGSPTDDLLVRETSERKWSFIKVGVC